MIGTIQALGIFLLMILPGFLGLRVYSYGRPPLRHRGALGELGAIVLVSALGWAFLYLWRGQDLLPIVLGESGRGADPSTRERLDAFAELAAFSVVIGVLLGALARAAGNAARSAALRLLKQGADSQWQGGARCPREWRRSRFRGRRTGPLLLDVEAYRDRSGKIKQVPGSQGLFVPGDEIAFLSVVRLPDEALSSETDDSA